MNQKLDIAAAIEKNRLALVRLVTCWLMLAVALRCRRNRVLPRRLGVFILTLIDKAETAASFLLDAAHCHQLRQNGCKIFPPSEQIRYQYRGINDTRHVTIDAVIQRLRALKHALGNLRPPKARKSQKLSLGTFCAFYHTKIHPQLIFNRTDNRPATARPP